MRIKTVFKTEDQESMSLSTAAGRWRQVAYVDKFEGYVACFAAEIRTYQS